MSGRLGGVPGGESRFRLLVIIREAALEAPRRISPGRGLGLQGTASVAALHISWRCTTLACLRMAMMSPTTVTPSSFMISLLRSSSMLFWILLSTNITA